MMIMSDVHFGCLFVDQPINQPNQEWKNEKTKTTTKNTDTQHMHNVWMCFGWWSSLMMVTESENIFFFVQKKPS